MQLVGCRVKYNTNGGFGAFSRRTLSEGTVTNKIGEAVEVRWDNRSERQWYHISFLIFLRNGLDRVLDEI